MIHPQDAFSNHPSEHQLVTEVTSFSDTGTQVGQPVTKTLPMSAEGDTTKLSVREFIRMGLKKSGQLQYQSHNVTLAENTLDAARLTRTLPSLHFSSQHGVIPGVYSSDTALSDGSLYLDPNLKNDWEDWAVFTRAELSAIQPIYTWGGIRNSIDAAQNAHDAASHQFEAAKAEAALQLYTLYYSRLLAREIQYILQDAQSVSDTVKDELESLLEQGDPDLQEADVFKFDLYMADFQIQRAEATASEAAVLRLWHHILQADPLTRYEPSSTRLQQTTAELTSFESYQTAAMYQRPEMKSLAAGIEATRLAVEASKSQFKPALLLGITASFAHTPNRPRQTNPFIINNTNYASAGIGLVLRQNLNFSSVANRVERNRIHYRQTQDLKIAVTDGLMLQLTEAYSDASAAQTKLDQTRQKLQTAKEWVRHEQLNWDLGFGEIDNLVEAVQKEFELRAELAQKIFDYNVKMATLYKASGLPLDQLTAQ